MKSIGVALKIDEVRPFCFWNHALNFLPRWHGRCFVKVIEMAFSPLWPKGGLPTSCAKQAAATTDEGRTCKGHLPAHSLPGQPKFRPLWPQQICPHWLLPANGSGSVMYKGVAGKGNTWVLFCSLWRQMKKSTGHSPAENGFCATRPKPIFRVGFQKYSFPSSAYPTYLEFFDVCGFLYIYLRHRTNLRGCQTHIFFDQSWKEGMIRQVNNQSLREFRLLLRCLTAFVFYPKH